MEDSDDEDAKLQEEIEAELEKISVFSLEQDELESDSVSDTKSDASDASLDELPESMLQSISLIKNQSKAAEELILQDVEEPDAFSCSYGALSSNYIHLRVGLSTEFKDSSEQLMKILSGIEKEEFMRRETHSARPESIPEPEHQDVPHPQDDAQDVSDPQDDPQYVPDPQNILVLPDDSDMDFGYFEVEERCRKSFEAWQDKQKELEGKQNETLKAQGDREKKQFQEEEEKRHCWMKQFEVDKKKLEDFWKKEQDKMNDELHREEKLWKEKSRQHEEFIRNLHLQMEEERARFNELQEQEKNRLLELQNSAAVKIQAKYKAFATYQKYGLIIKEQLESKRRKAQEWKEKEAKIRQKDEESQKRLEEEHRIREEIKRQMQEERKRRDNEYEEKKKILRQEREALHIEKSRLKENFGQQLIISSALRKRDCHNKHAAIANKNKGRIAQVLKEAHSSRKQEVYLFQQSDKRENLDRQLTLNECTGVQLKSSQAILTEVKVTQKSEDLAIKECSEKIVMYEEKYENIFPNPELENTDLKENKNEQFQMQELKSQAQNKEDLEPIIHDNMQEEIQIDEHSQEMNEVKNTEAQKIISNQQRTMQSAVKEIPKQSELLCEQNNTPVVLMKQNLLPLKLENCETTCSNVILEDKEMNLKSKELEEFPKDKTLSSDTEVSNTIDVIADTEGKIKKQEYKLGKNAPTKDLVSYDAESFLAAKEGNSLKYEIKEIQGECHENGSECESIMTHSTPESTLLSSIEERRQAWMKSCKPWFEIFKEYQQKKIIKRKRTVKCPANMMPPLSTSDILQCGPWNNLQQVTTITLQDLPGCNLSTLAECTNLQVLSLQRCGLVSLNGLNPCRKLKTIDVQENHIETINCANMENLSIVLLSKNQLTSIHGLDGCTNIQNLELSHNKITRIGGLESLKYLQHLIVDHNQLISTKGLFDSPSIIYLDCSYNHLTNVDGIENCGLLQILKLQGNYLSEPPSLRNHVLLRELHLDDNSISTTETFSSYWLPLLQDLTLSQNSLTKIVPLSYFVSLEKLDVSNNCLSDLTSAMEWFDSCHSLRELSLTGNPLLQEKNGRNYLLKILPALRVLNGEILASSVEVPTKGDYHQDTGGFLTLCQSQIQELNLLTENCTTQKANVLALSAVEDLCRYFKKLMKLSIEYRHAHEHGDMNITQRVESETQISHVSFSSSDNTLQNVVFQSCASKYNTDLPDICEKLMDFDSTNTPLNCEDMEERNQKNLIGPRREDNKTNSIPTKTIIEIGTANSPLSSHRDIEQHQTILAAMVIQAHWRGYIVRRQSRFSAKILPTATKILPNSSINNQITIKKERRGNMNTQEQREKAALHIQAVWKGFILRKKLVTALEAIKSEESGEEYEEINLEDFIFDENSGILKYDDISLNIPTCPAQAWLCDEKENASSSEHTQLNSRSESRTLSRTPESKTNTKNLLKSEKEERISEEWGFKDISTAQQMLKRAEKMKSKKSKKKDPTVRLALFKNNESKVPVTKPLKKKQPRRYGYFEGKAEDVIYKDICADEKLERSKEYTYQWLHTQAGIHETNISRNMKCNHFLPELNPDVLNGGRVQLVAGLVSREDTDLDLFSITSGSTLSVNREKKSQTHRHSAGSSSCSSKGKLASTITHARPSNKERISFRDNPVRLSGGWGSGKKKAKTSS